MFSHPRVTYEMDVEQGGYPIHGPSGFCGNKGTGTAVHEDAQLTNFWMWLSHGEKHWRMFKCVPRTHFYH